MINNQLFVTVHIICSIFCLYALIHDHLCLSKNMNLLEFLEVLILSFLPLVGVVITILVIGKMTKGLCIKILNKFRNTTILYSK